VALLAEEPDNARRRRSTGVEAETLDRLASAHEATIENAVRLLVRRKQDPWTGYFDVDQVLPLARLTAK
jgi:hypothetical protein